MKEQKPALITKNNFVFDDFMKSYTKWIYLTKGNMNVPFDYIDTSAKPAYPLGQVVNYLRFNIKTKKPKISLTAEEMEKINKIGFVWNPNFKYDEKDFLDRVEKYSKTHTDKRIKLGYECEDGYPLGKKFEMVRNGYLIKHNNLPEDTPHINVSEKVYKKLEELGQVLDMNFYWKTHRRNKNSRVFEFDDFFEHLIKYYEQQKQINAEKPYYIPIKTVMEDGYKLGMFATRLRSVKKMIENQNWKYVLAAYNLKPSQWKKLDYANFIYCQDEVFDFKKAHNELLMFKEQFGHLVVPQNYVSKDGYALGRAVSHLRTAKNENDRFAKLKQSQINELNNIEFVWKIKYVNFDYFIKRFTKYNMFGGNEYVPSNAVLRDGYEIGQDALLIRLGENFKEELSNSHLPKLSPEQKQKLISKGFLFHQGPSAEHVITKTTK